MMIMNSKPHCLYKECLEKIITSKNVILEPVHYQDALKEVCNYFNFLLILQRKVLFIFLHSKAFDDTPFMTPDSATNLITIVLPLLRKSSGSNVRNLFVNMLRRAMSSSLLGIRQMAVFGFGLLLKQIKYNEITDNIKPHDLTGAYITGYSLRNQMTQMNINNLSPHDMMTLEVMGALTRALCLNYEVKHVMYKGLRKAAMNNYKVLPHVIDFLIPHLRNYIDNTGSNIVLKLDAIIEDNMEIVVVKDNFATLTEVLVHCVIEADMKKIKIENIFLRELFTSSLDKVLLINYNQLDIASIHQH